MSENTDIENNMKQIYEHIAEIGKIAMKTDLEPREIYYDVLSELATVMEIKELILEDFEIHN